MGLHSPFGYVGYEATFTRTFCELLKQYCTNCHTDADYPSGCLDCPIGNLLYEIRKYLLDAHESDILKEQANLRRKIKSIVEKIKPHPGWGWGVMHESEKSVAERGLLTELKGLQEKL